MLDNIVVRFLPKRLPIRLLLALRRQLQRSTRRLVVRYRFLVRPLQRRKKCAAEFQWVFDCFKAWGEGFRMVIAEVMMTGACCDDQSIIGQRTVIQQDASLIHVDTHYLC